jgi:hypothetical protein
MKKFISTVYIAGMLVLTVGFIILIWDVTFGHLLKGLQPEGGHKSALLKAVSPKADKDKSTFQTVIIEGDETVRRYLGYRVLEERRIEGHFHLIDMNVGHDKSNYCISCHGDIPHDKVKEIRAFGNMHSSFISCQTCHIRLEGDDKTGVFKWYDKSTGEIVPSPIREGVLPGTYNAKILPFERVDGKLQRIDSHEKIDFAREYSEQEKLLSDVQKSKAKKIIHQQVAKKSYSCEDCHQKEAPLLPFKELGFSSHRVEVIVSTEVIGMIKKYTQFYIPRILEPGFGSGGAGQQNP